MCLIVYSPTGKLLPIDQFENANSHNPDGIGFMSAKGHAKFCGPKQLQHAKAYMRGVLGGDTPFAMHFRYATHGKVHKINTHPFNAPDSNAWVMHNGVLSMCTALATKEKSDTRVYVDTYLRGIPTQEEDANFYVMLKAHITSGNKMVIYHKDVNRFVIVNEYMGDWKEGIWYSNLYSIDPPYTARGYGSYGGSYTSSTYSSEYWKSMVADAIKNDDDRSGTNICDAGGCEPTTSTTRNGVVYYNDWKTWWESRQAQKAKAQGAALEKLPGTALVPVNTSTNIEPLKSDADIASEDQRVLSVAQVHDLQYEFEDWIKEQDVNKLVKTIRWQELCPDYGWLYTTYGAVHPVCVHMKTNKLVDMMTTIEVEAKDYAEQQGVDFPDSVEED